MRNLIFLLALSLLSVFSGFSQVLPVPVPPTSTPISSDFAGVADYANLLDSAHLDLINRLLKELKQKTTASIVVLTVKTGSRQLDRTQADAYASLIYKEWHLTNAPVDNTVLFLVTTDESLQTFQPTIFRGPAMREVIDTVKAETLIEKYFTPAIEQKEYTKAIYETTWALAYILAQVYQQPLSEKPPFEGDPLTDSGSSAGAALWLIGLIVIVAFIYHRMRQHNPELSWSRWLPGKRKRAIARDSRWKGAFDRGNFGGLR